MKRNGTWNLVTAGLLAAIVIGLVATFALGAETGRAPAGEAKPAPAPSRHIDLAICLDTSGSMQGLIESAKQKLWAVVNELATARPRPLLRVGLYHYGNTRLSKQTGWVQRLCPLTDDLDTVYGKLFALRTNGGTEYVARVVRAATRELKWSGDKNALRIIFVAGNEPATQDERNYKLRDVCAAAAARGIIINTIFCGRADQGRRTGWADAARWADGRYAAIDQKAGTVAVATPHDRKLAELGGRLNATYVAYGARGQRGRANQIAQDANARKLGAAAAAERAAGKSSALYRNVTWDLVDALREDKADLAKLPKDQLPEEMRKMTLEQRKAHLAAKAAERARIQKQIRTLNVKRSAYIKTERARLGLSGKETLDAALRAAIRVQAKARNFTFEKK